MGFLVTLIFSALDGIDGMAFAHPIEYLLHRVNTWQHIFYYFPLFAH